jgi:hypothetical protein
MARFRRISACGSEREIGLEMGVVRLKAWPRQARSPSKSTRSRPSAAVARRTFIIAIALIPRVIRAPLA